MGLLSHHFATLELFGQEASIEEKYRPGVRRLIGTGYLYGCRVSPHILLIADSTVDKVSNIVKTAALIIAEIICTDLGRQCKFGRWCMYVHIHICNQYRPIANLENILQFTVVLVMAFTAFPASTKPSPGSLIAFR